MKHSPILYFASFSFALFFLVPTVGHAQRAPLPCKDQLEAAKEKGFDPKSAFQDSSGGGHDRGAFCSKVQAFLATHPDTQTPASPSSPASSNQPTHKVLGAKPATPQKTDLTVADAKKYVKGFQIVLNSNTNTIEVSGMIPTQCKGDLEVEAYKAPTGNALEFEISDADGKGISCLKTNFRLCGENQNSCVSLSSLYSDKDLGSRFRTQVGLDEMKAGPLKVGYVYGENGQWKNQDSGDQEDGLLAIDSCGCKKVDASPVLTQSQTQNVRDVGQAVVVAASARPSTPADKRKDKEKLNDEKRTVVRKIKSLHCPKDDDEDFEDMDAVTDLEANLDPSLQDDVDDAIEVREKECAVNKIQARNEAMFGQAGFGQNYAGLETPPQQLMARMSPAMGMGMPPMMGMGMPPMMGMGMPPMMGMGMPPMMGMGMPPMMGMGMPPMMGMGMGTQSYSPYGYPFYGTYGLAATGALGTSGTVGSALMGLGSGLSNLFIGMSIH